VTDLHEIMERADDARFWRETPAFKAWLDQERTELHALMMGPSLTVEEILLIRAEQRAVERLASRLKAFVDGFKKDVRQAS
jgi:hypothetical protein